MNATSQSEFGDGIVESLKEAADGLGCLLADHIRLARLELIADAKIVGRKVSLVAVAIPFFFFGHALVCASLVLSLSGWLGLAGALFVVGAVQVAAALATVFVALRRLSDARMTRAKVPEAAGSVSTLETGPVAAKRPTATCADQTLSATRSSLGAPPSSHQARS